MPLDLARVAAVQVNRSAVERRAATIPTRRTVKKEWQAAWLLRAITCIDLTTLAGDDTPGNVRRLCAKARQPVRGDILERLGALSLGIHTGAVCVYHNLVPVAVEALAGTDIPGRGGLDRLPRRAESIAAEDRGDRGVGRGGRAGDRYRHLAAHVLDGRLARALRRGARVPAACGDAHMKTILATGELGTLRNVARASWVCMMAGADFIKTSTGKETVNATLPVSLVMVRAIREYAEATGQRVGFKPAGGIRTAKQSLDWLVADERGVGRRVAAGRSLPHRRQRAAHRHRATVGVLRQRPLLGGVPPADGLA